MNNDTPKQEGSQPFADASGSAITDNQTTYKTTPPPPRDRREMMLGDPQIDHMAKWKEYGRTPAGLRKWAEMIGDNPELRVGYCICVLKSAADEMERLQSPNDKVSDGR